MTAADRPTLTVLGAGPAYTDRPGSSGAAYLVRTAETAILLDLGQGSFPRLAATLEPSTPGRGRDQPPPPRPLHRSGAAAPLSGVPVRGRLAASGSSARRASPSGSTPCTRARASPPNRSTWRSCRTLVSRCPSATSPRGAARDPHGGQPRGPARADERRSRASSTPGDCGRAGDLAPLIRPGDTLLVEVSFGIGPVPPGALPPRRAGDRWPRARRGSRRGPPHPPPDGV